MFGNTVGGVPRVFSSGNKGWYCGGKVLIKIGKKKLWVRLAAAAAAAECRVVVVVIVVRNTRVAERFLIATRTFLLSAVALCMNG